MSKKSLDLEYMEAVKVKTGLRSGIADALLYGVRPPILLYGVLD